MVASARAKGTDRATLNIRHSFSSGSITDGLSGSSRAWCSPLATSTAPRRTINGHSTAISASVRRTRASKARIACNTAKASSGRWCRIEQQVTAKFADPPGADQVAEVDDAVRTHAAGGVERPDHVVVGGVAMDGLDRKRIHEGSDARLHFGGRLDHLPAALRIAD